MATQLMTTTMATTDNVEKKSMTSTTTVATKNCNNNNNDCIATQVALELEALAIKQAKTAESEKPAQPIPSSPRPLPEELRYRPHTQEKWRESLNGNYNVTQKSLGEGASGKVILAADRRNGRVVAVKVVPKGRLRPDQLERIRREYSIMNHVSHKHLISLVEVVENPHEICIVMEYAADGDLFSLISGSANERLEEEEARDVFRQVAKGVRHLHRRGFVHRDIKPENIFMSDGRAILGDFGYGMQYDYDMPSSTSVGSLHYASPEVILKESTYIGPEIDIWSLGCVLYAMVCGYTPFQGETVKDTKLAIVRGFLEFPSFLSSEVQSLIRHMLDLDASQRYTIDQVLAHEWTCPEKRLKRQDTVETIIAAAKQLGATEAATERMEAADAEEPTTDDTTASSSATSVPTGDSAAERPADPLSVTWCFDSAPDYMAEAWSASVSSSSSASSSPSSSYGAIPLPVHQEHRASTLRALLPRLPLAKLRQLWQGDKGGRLSPGTLSPTSPSTGSPSPKTSPSSLTSSLASSPRTSSPRTSSPKMSSKAFNEGRLSSLLGERRSTCPELPAAALAAAAAAVSGSGSDSAPHQAVAGPSDDDKSGRHRRHTTSPRLMLTSPRKAFANFTDKIMSPRRKGSKGSAPPPLQPLSSSAPIAPESCQEVPPSPSGSRRAQSPRHVLFHSDAHSAAQVLNEKGKERCGDCHSSIASSGEHVTFAL